jgi:hypothetical protein
LTTTFSGIFDITNPAIPFGCSVQLSVGPQGPFAETGCRPAAGDHPGKAVQPDVECP